MAKPTPIIWMEIAFKIQDIAIKNDKLEKNIS